VRVQLDFQSGWQTPRESKVHESLLRTAINATHLNIAIKLLRYQSSPELFMLRDEEGFPNGLMPAGPWVYGGSAVYNGRYVSEVTGDIVAILTNQAAIFNYPGDNNRDGEDYGSWYALTKMIPDVGTAVIVEIRPWSPAAEPASKPTPKPAPKAE
jgi:hypothetical protein